MMLIFKTYIVSGKKHEENLDSETEEYKYTSQAP